MTTNTTATRTTANPANLDNLLAGAFKALPEDGPPHRSPREPGSETGKGPHGVAPVWSAAARVLVVAAVLVVIVVGGLSMAPQAGRAGLFVLVIFDMVLIAGAVKSARDEFRRGR